MTSLNLSSSKNIILSERSHLCIFKALTNISTLNLGGLTFRGDFSLSEALSHLTKLKVLEISDIKVQDEILADGLSHPPLLTRLVMQETMTDQKQLIKIINFQSMLTHLDLSRYCTEHITCKSPSLNYDCA